MLTYPWKEEFSSEVDDTSATRKGNPEVSAAQHQQWWATPNAQQDEQKRRSMLGGCGTVLKQEIATTVSTPGNIPHLTGPTHIVWVPLQDHWWTESFPDMTPEWFWKQGLCPTSHLNGHKETPPRSAETCYMKPASKSHSGRTSAEERCQAHPVIQQYLWGFKSY